MYMETVPNRTSPPAILLREGWREDGAFAPGEEGLPAPVKWCAVLHLGEHFWFYVILWTVAAIQRAPCPPPGLSRHSEAPCLAPVRVTSGYGRGIKTFRHKCMF